jgi:pimeloyl-ACP methyl ester carboxylesterase
MTVASGFVLPPQRSLNELLDQAADGLPVLVFQGRLDPLNNAERRANTLKTVYPAADVQSEDLGHCPHDENPDLFNARIATWMSKVSAAEHDSAVVPAARSPVS